ncbi:MAG: N-acetylgalactosamine-6-sulfatase, partial [Opitutae bacterium]|nr:N-acetylgalactosamine-6-sulfatase [Opitutae bacterium]
LIPKVISHEIQNETVTFSVREQGAKIVRADLIYTNNGGKKYEEWYRIKGKEKTKGTISFNLPEGSTHYYLNLIDENNFLVSYPETPDYSELGKTKEKFAKFAIARK